MELFELVFECLVYTQFFTLVFFCSNNILVKEISLSNLLLDFLHVFLDDLLFSLVITCHELQVKLDSLLGRLIVGLLLDDFTFFSLCDS